MTVRLLAGVVLAAAIAVSPEDRLAMADRLFNRGEFALAESEYKSLVGEKSVAADELAYRLAECARALDRKDEARGHYQRLVREYPSSRLVNRARLQLALEKQGGERALALEALVGESVEAPVRACALYRLGEVKGDENLFRRCVAAQPNGPYAAYARIARAAVLAKSDSPEKRREAVSQYLEVAFAKNEKLSEDALYMAASASHSFGKYDEASSLYRRYMRNYPKGGHAKDAVERCAACECQLGKHSDVLALCGDGGTDELDFWRMQATYRLGETERATTLVRKYLTDYPRGKYRKSAQDVLARLDYVAAEKAGDFVRMTDAAKRICANGGTAADRLRLAWAVEKSGRTNEAARAYLDLAAEFPGTADAAEAMYRKGCVDIRSGKWQPAELAFKEALAGRLDPRRVPSAKYLRGMAACRASHEEEGAEFLRQAVAAGLPLDEDREARLAIADVDYNAGRTNEAIVAYTRLVREGAVVRMSAAKTLAVGRILAPPEKKTCAMALAKSASAEWRQFAHALLGEAEESLGNRTAAVAAWEKCVAEGCETEVLKSVLIKLGKARCESGDRAGADELLRRAVAVNGADDTARAEAYLALARNALAAGDKEAAKGYATVIVTLFEKSRFAADAEKLLVEIGSK